MNVSFEALQRLHNIRKTQVVEYDSHWGVQFETEAALLRRVFGDIALSIQHIGSTAIPGIKAKPIIDILITVGDLNAVDAFDDTMETMGYDAGGEFGLFGRRFYCKGDEAQCHFHVHVYEATNPSVEKYRLFREYMIAHPDDATAYAGLKTDLARQYPNNRTLYTESKGAFIEKIYKKATEWFGKK